MRICTYDFEVSAYDWLVVFKDYESGQYTVIHNDNDAFRDCISSDVLYVGFNSKHYDQFVAKAIFGDLTNQEIKQVNDYIIGGGRGWECPLLQDIYFSFNNVDIRDDMQQTLSLKSIEGHLGMDIEETSVDFNLGRPWTNEELNRMVFYCKHDVDATEKIMEIRKDYLVTKANLGKRAGISEAKAMGSTNAKLTALMLRAERKTWTDGRDYVYPDKLDLSMIPKPILEFFDQIHDLTIPDEDLFGRSFEIEIGGMPCKYAWGGAHGSLTGYFEEATDTRVIRNTDVSSLYPSLIELYGYLSRNVPSPDLFYNIRKDRIAAKHRGDKQLAKDLKLPLNTVSGAQENQYNDLYDPLPTRSLRISGQLFTTVLLMRLVKSCRTFKPINYNTDGIAYSIDRSEVDVADRICKEWEAETGFELETDEISKMWVKDVNNLLIIKTDGSVKTVGGYLNYGVSEKGAWGINNAAVVVKKALIDYFVHGTPVEDTIKNDSDILDFQFIAKAGSKYSRAYQIVNGEEVTVQNVNRVYATSDEKFGTLYKVKRETGGVAKIENLPDHCIIDNRNELGIEAVDKQFYIDLANKRINDFMGVKPEKKTRRKSMATTTTKATPMNVYQKLIKARETFLNAGVQKSGMHMRLEFKYFELDDIVPAATKIFAEIGLIPIYGFHDDKAELTVVNTDNPEDKVVFTAPFVKIEPIESNTGKAVTNSIQALGASITYMRRYLYMLAMDIVEADAIDAGTMDKPALAPKAPATPAKREEIKEGLTDPKRMADATQIKGLKNVLTKLVKADPEYQVLKDEITLTTENFKNITREKCEKMVESITSLLDGMEGETE